MGRATRRVGLLAALIPLVGGIPAFAAQLTVTATADAINGDVSSPAALLLSPGPDGISLREAIEAVNSERGPHTITISPALADQTITLTGPLPAILRDGVAIAGPRNSTNQPAVTISGSAVSPSLTVLQIFASGFRITGLRFAAVRGVGSGTVLFIRAGRPELPSSAEISDVRIEENVFDNTDFSDSGNAITVATENGSSGATVRNVTIANNIFVRFQGEIDAIGAGIGGTDGRFENLVISENTFSQNSFPFEIALTGSNGRFSGVRIVRNTFRDNFQTITFTGSQSLPGFPPAFGNVLEDVLIAGNVISGSQNPSIQMLAGFDATESAIRDTQIVNNVITGGGTCGVCVQGGSGSSASGNQVEGIQVVNNTIVGGAEFHAGVSIFANHNGATGNSVSGVSVRNTIFVEGGKDFGGDQRPGQIVHCITSDTAVVGLDGNISGDPRFVDPSAGDYRLRPGSPAIDAGTSDGAPSRDLEGRPRFDDPAKPNRGGGAIRYYDMGAYEYSTLPTYHLTVITTGRGSGRVTSDPAGIDCGIECSALFYAGARVTLTPVADSGSIFAGWIGDAACAIGVVTLAADTTCTARFSRSRRTIVVPFRP